MKRLLLLGMLGVCVLLAPAGCVMSLALASASIAAASTDPACLSEEASDPSECVPGWAGTGSPRAPVAIDPGSIPAPDPAAAAAVAAAIEAVGRRGRYIPEGNGPVDFDCSGLTSFAWRAAGQFPAHVLVHVGGERRENAHRGAGVPGHPYAHGLVRVRGEGGQDRNRGVRMGGDEQGVTGRADHHLHQFTWDAWVPPAMYRVYHLDRFARAFASREAALKFVYSNRVPEDFEILDSSDH